MAMASRTRFRHRRRARQGKREFIWTTQTILHLPIGVAGGTIFDFITNVVSPTDWVRDVANINVLEKGAVLQRIVGDLWFSVDTSGGTAGLRARTAADTVHGFVKRDADDVSNMDLAVDAYGEDWLQLHHECIDTIFDPTPTLTFWGGGLNVHRAVDVRVKRKLTSDEVIGFYVCDMSSAGLQNSRVVSGTLRALIALP